MSSPLVGVDVGGTKIAAALVTPDGRLGRTVERPTPAADGPAAVLDAIAEAVRALPGHRSARGVGVGTGGVVDRRHGVVRSANALLPGWAGTDLRAELGARLGLPVVADNDVNAFALAEQRFGAGVGHRAVLYVSVGTGIGGALVLDGALYRGAHFTAGELGHLAVPEAAGRPCNCGRVGHLEAVAAGPALSARYGELTGTRDVSATDVRVVAARAADGDAHAARVIAAGAAALGRALGGLVNTLDVERVVVGGGVLGVGDRYWRPLTEAFAAELLPGPSGVRPVRAALGPRSAVVGAAALLLEEGPPDASPDSSTDTR